MDKKENIDTDIIIVTDDDDKSKKTKSHSNKTKKHKRKVKVDTTNNAETLIITQNVQIKEQKFQCIINLTKICDNKKQKMKCSKASSKERITPQCLRNKCKSEINSKICKRRQYKGKQKHNTSKNTSGPKSISKRKARTSKSRILLSPVSSITLEDKCQTDISYESISSGSFVSDEELDTLIKRTKDRDRRLSETTSQPHYTSTSPIEMNCINTPPYISTPLNSEMDSIHSLATLILDPWSENIYSPHYPTESPTIVLESEAISSVTNSSNLDNQNLNKSDFPINPSRLVYSHKEKEYKLNFPNVCTVGSKDYGVVLNPNQSSKFKLDLNSPKFISPSEHMDSVNRELPLNIALEDHIPYSPTISPSNLLYPEMKQTRKSQASSLVAYKNIEMTTPYSPTMSPLRLDSRLSAHSPLSIPPKNIETYLVNEKFSPIQSTEYLLMMTDGHPGIHKTENENTKMNSNSIPYMKVEKPDVVYAYNGEFYNNISNENISDPHTFLSNTNMYNQLKHNHTNCNIYL